MTLPNAVQGAGHTPRRITWEDEDGDPVNLTGATISGRIRAENDASVRDVDGVLTIVDATSGIFDWTLGTADIADAGTFSVQFTATFAGGEMDITHTHAWEVIPAI